MATHSSILAWRIPKIEEPGGLQSMGSERIEHDSATNPHLHTPLVVSSPLGISQHNYIQFTQKDCLQIFQHRSGLLKSS